MKRLRIYRELEISEGQIKEGNTIEVRKEGEKLQFLPVTPNNK